MLFDLHLPHYFSKGVRQEVSDLSVSTGIDEFATSMVAIFEPIFLYSTLHFTVPHVLLFMGAVYFIFIFTLPFGARFASLYGYKHSIILSIPFQILFWVCLFGAQVHQVFVFVAPLALALQKTFYWPGFHSIIARFGTREQKGREFSFIYAIVNIVHIAGPFLGGFLSQKYGVGAAFFVAAIIFCGSAIPLLFQEELFAPKRYQYNDTVTLYKSLPKKSLGYMGFGEDLLVLTVWPIFIYIVVKNYQDTGTLATVASFAAALIALLMGKIADTYTKRILVKIGALFLSLTWFIHFVGTSFLSVLGIDAVSRAAKDIVFIPLSTLTYLRAEANHIMAYVVFYEQSIAIGKLSACILGALLFLVVGSGTLGFISLFILAGFYSLLYMFV